MDIFKFGFEAFNQICMCGEKKYWICEKKKNKEICLLPILPICLWTVHVFGPIGFGIPTYEKLFKK